MPSIGGSEMAPRPTRVGLEGPLAGRVALVTGGGGGLGEALCRALGAAGARVVVADVRLDAAERLGGLDTLVNSAGVFQFRALEEIATAEWDRILDVNLRGPFLMSRQVFGMMRARGSGHIVNIVSTAAKRAWANAAAYHASKWGLLGLSHALHVEGRPHGVKVTAVVAGGMRTPFLLDRFPDLDPEVLQDAANVAATVVFVLTQPDETVVPEITVLPMRETSWP